MEHIKIKEFSVTQANPQTTLMFNESKSVDIFN